MPLEALANSFRLTSSLTCNSLNKNSSFHKIWNTVKRMNNFDNTSNIIPIIRVGNKVYNTDEQKVEALANSFRLTSSDVNYEKLFLTKRKSFLLENKSINMKQNSGESILEEDFNIQELKLIVKALKNSAPGKDNITNEKNYFKKILK